MGYDALATLPASTVRVLAQGDGWCLSDVVCRRGPEDRRFEERHAGVSLGAVISGTFQYRGTQGRALLHPGAVLLGNDGDCFECGHEHGRGDRCLALRFNADAFAQIAHGATGDARFRLGIPMLPAVRTTLAPLSRLQRQLAQRDAAAIEDAVLEFAGAVVSALSPAPAPCRVGARDQRRIVEVVRYMERHAAEPLDLDRLARLACMSKYHFLRCFRRGLGVTPHQFLLQQRLALAARALRERASDPIMTIALDCGFRDLSGFNAMFRATFGRTPRAFRQAG